MTTARTVAPLGARILIVALLFLAVTAAVRPIGSQPAIYPTNATFLAVAPFEARAAAQPTAPLPATEPTQAPAPTPVPTAAPVMVQVQAIHPQPVSAPAAADTAPPPAAVTLPNGAQMTEQEYADLNNPAQNGGSSAGAGCTFPIVNGICGNGADIRGTADTAPIVMKTDEEGARTTARPGAPEGQQP